jgi:hypothetical protein
MADYNPTGRPRISSPVVRKEDPGKWSYLRDGIAGSTVKFDNDVADITSNLFDLLIKKHKDYGPKNIALSPGGPLNGLRVRMWDKLARINNLVESGARPENESLIDSFRDMANYSIIAIMVLEGKWPSDNSSNTN